MEKKEVSRFKFTKTKLLALKPPEKGRDTHYDETVQKFALRHTAADTKTFYVIKRDGAQMAWHKLGTFPDMTVEDARDAAESSLGDFAKGNSPVKAKQVAKLRITLGQAFDKYMELYAEPRGRKTTDDQRKLWERCVGTLPDEPAKKHGRKREKHPAGKDWTDRKMDEIGNADVRTLHAEIGSHTPILANRVVELISTVYNRAVEWGYPGPNPATGIEPFAENERDRFIQADELPKFFKALEADNSTDFKHFVLLCLLTGARRKNVLEAKWEDVNIPAATWRIAAADSKNKQPMLLPLAPEAIEIFAARKPADDEENKSTFVFPAASRSGHMTPPKGRWQALLKRAGIADFRIHDLRRSLGSWQAIGGASLAVIGKSLGHKDIASTMIYARLHMDPVRASVNTATTAMLQAAGVKKVIKTKQGRATK